MIKPSALTGLFSAVALAFLTTSFYCPTSYADVDLSGAAPPAGAVWLDSLPLDTMTTGFGTASAGKAIDGGPILLSGKTYVHGIGTHAVSRYLVDLHGSATRFQCEVGVDDGSGKMGSVTFAVLVDGVDKVTTSVMHSGDKPIFLDVDLTGAKKMELLVGDGGDGIAYDHADWAGAAISVTPAGAAPTPMTIPIEAPRLTIPAETPTPEIHYPRITGATPGRPFLFLIPATGQAPLTFNAVGLPAGLRINPKRGAITGTLLGPGITHVELIVTNALGSAHSTLTIEGGDHLLARTPPMGWNSWNVWAGAVDENKVKAAADVLVADGLTGHGYEYVNIDDTWEGGRDAEGNIQSNIKFPDMKALTDYIHAKGLKAGIYSSPGPRTCAGYTACYQHEAQDATSYANWGFDYLKYDWCSYGNIDPNPDLAGFEKPYAVMRSALDKVDRDLVYSLCQYGMGDVWIWGADPIIKANTWRTHNDIDDVWIGGGRGLDDIINSMNGLSAFAGPGHWNDPDMLMVGIVGFGNTHPTRLTPNEQITHISFWCLYSSPLLIGCDLTRLDAFTRALLTNDEAIAIDQDELGKPAQLITTTTGGGQIWARPLFDGSKAVGLFNPSDAPLDITVTATELGLTGNQSVRDLWLHKNVGRLGESYTVNVPTHGTVLLKISPAGM